uniref:Uncharacterized protein n=1 Tax=Globodera rostochiensis TaxID=31243 RepID=A0A914GR98_GLORO
MTKQQQQQQQKQQVQISQAVCEAYPFLCVLTRTKSMRKRRQMLKSANSQQLLALAEICLNIVRARFKLTTRQKSRMMPYADFIRRLSRARSERGARQLLIQKGSGFALQLFPSLLTPIILELSRILFSHKQ